MRGFVLLATFVLLLGAPCGGQKGACPPEELNPAIVEVQQQNEARIAEICQEITVGSSEATDQLSECCSLQEVDRAECFTSVQQDHPGHHHGELGAIVEYLKDPKLAALKHYYMKAGSRQAIVGPEKSPNPLYAALFMPPRGDDTEGVDLVCKILDHSMDEDACGSPMDWKQRKDVCHLPEIRSHHLKQRKERLGTCCQATGQEKVDCFESLRLKMADRICDVEPLTIRHKVGLPNPCCEVTGQDRVQCIDKIRYGFNGEAGRFFQDDYACTSGLMSFNGVHLSVPRNQSQAQQFCSWLGGNHQIIPYDESEELSLLRLDPEQMWGSLFRKEARCCLHTGTKLMTCLNEVRETRNDEMCSNRARTNNAVTLLYWLEWVKSLATGTTPALEVLAGAKDFPDNDCCGMTGAVRHTCLAHLFRPFDATVDTSDHSPKLFEGVKRGCEQMDQKKGKHGTWDNNYGFVIYPHKKGE